MSRRKAITLAVAIAIAVAVAVPFLVRRSSGFYTDGVGLKSEAGAARPFLRDVLWEPAAPVAGVNLPEEDEYEPRVSPDGGLLVFTRGRRDFPRSSPGLPRSSPGLPRSSPGLARPGAADLWIAVRDGNHWAEPRPLEGVNSDHDEMGAAFGPARPGGAGDPGEGLALYFSSDRPGGEGGYDIWVSVRDERGDWGRPVNLGPPINTPRHEVSPLPSPDGAFLYFAGDCHGRTTALFPRWSATLREAIEPPDYDIHRAPRLPGEGIAFGDASPLDPLNTVGHSEGSLALSPRGEILYFSSDRPGGRGGFDIYRSRLLDGAIERPENLGPGINSGAHELDPAIASGGFELYFARGEPGVRPDDLFVSASREVFLRRERGEPYWSLAPLRAALFSLLRKIDPTLLALVLSVIAAIIFAVLFGKRMTRLGLLARCIVLALFIHVLLALWMGSTRVHRILIANLSVEGDAVAIEVTFGGEAEEEVSFAIRTETAETGRDAPPGLDMAWTGERPAGAVASSPAPGPALGIAAAADLPGPEPGPLPAPPPVDPALRDLARAPEAFARTAILPGPPRDAEFLPGPREPGREAPPPAREPEIGLAALREGTLAEADLRAGADLLPEPTVPAASDFRERLALAARPGVETTSPLADPRSEPDPVLRHGPVPGDLVDAAESLAAARDTGAPPVVPAIPAPAISRDMTRPGGGVRLEPAERALDLEPSPAGAPGPAAFLAGVGSPGIEREAASREEAAAGILSGAVLPDVIARAPAARATESEAVRTAQGALEVVSRAGAPDAASPGTWRVEPPSSLVFLPPGEVSRGDVPNVPPGPSVSAPAATREPAGHAPTEPLLGAAARPATESAPEVAGERSPESGEASALFASDASPETAVARRGPQAAAPAVDSKPAAGLDAVSAPTLPHGQLPDTVMPAPSAGSFRTALVETAPGATLPGAALAPTASTPAARQTGPERAREAESELEVVLRVAVAASSGPGDAAGPAPVRVEAPSSLVLLSPGEAARAGVSAGAGPSVSIPAATREPAGHAPTEPLLGAAARPATESAPEVAGERSPESGEASALFASDASPETAVARRGLQAAAPAVDSKPAAGLEAVSAPALPRGQLPDTAAPAPSASSFRTALVETAARETVLTVRPELPGAPPVAGAAGDGRAELPALPPGPGDAGAIAVARKAAPATAPARNEDLPPRVASLAASAGPLEAAPAPPTASLPPPRSRDAPVGTAGTAAGEAILLPSARLAATGESPRLMARSPGAPGGSPSQDPPSSFPVIPHERMERPGPGAETSARPAAGLAVARAVHATWVAASRSPAATPASLRGEPLSPRRLLAPAEAPLPAAAPRSAAATPPGESAARIASPDGAPLEPSRGTAMAPATVLDRSAGGIPSLALSGGAPSSAPVPRRAEVLEPPRGGALAGTAGGPSIPSGLPPRAESPAPSSVPPVRGEAQPPPSPPGAGDSVDLAVRRKERPAAAPAPLLLDPHPALGTAAPARPLPAKSSPRGEVLPAPSKGGSLALTASAPEGKAGSDASSSRPEASTFVPRIYQLREKGKREEAVKRGGGSPETERAVERGLLWLAQHQSEDGRWSLFDYTRHLPRVSERDLWTPDWDGRGRYDARGGSGRAENGDTAATGLAILAFLGHGDTQVTNGAFSENVKRGLEFLVRSQRRDGDLRGGGNLYMHAIAAFAICEAYALTHDPALEEPARRAVGYTLRTQNPDLGGWRYDPYPEGQDVDTSVFGWMLMALKSARLAGISIDDRSVSRMVRYIESARMTEAGGRYAYQPNLPRTSLAMTAQGFFCQQVLHELRPPGNEEEERRLRRAAAESVSYILKNKPVARDQDGANDYYWYYASLALFQEGGEAWTAWNDRLKEVLLKLQLDDAAGTAAGSWDPLSRRARSGGRVYATAISILCLEVYYRYAKKETGR